MTLTSEVAEGKWFGYRVRVVSWLREMGWLREGEQLSRDLDQPMRDAFLAGFESGAKWGIQTSAKLSDPSFREAIAAVAEGLNRDG